MSLLHRIVRLFKADMHGLLDALEEPDVMLKQALREMQEEIERSQARLKTVSKQLERLAQQNRELDGTLAEIDNQIDFCFSENNEAMAKTLLRKKLETRQSLKATAQRRKALAEEQAQLEAELVGRQDKLQSILDKIALFSEQHTDSGAGAYDSGEGVLKTVTQEDVDLAFLQEKQQRMQRQAQQERQP